MSPESQARAAAKSRTLARERMHAPDGGYRLTAHDPAFAAQMAAFEEVMREDRDVLRALAKR